MQACLSDFKSTISEEGKLAMIKEAKKQNTEGEQIRLTMPIINLCQSASLFGYHDDYLIFFTSKHTKTIFS